MHGEFYVTSLWSQVLSLWSFAAEKCCSPKDSELEEEKEWLQLYAEHALFSKWQAKWDGMEPAKPFEMKKIVVSTKENVESWKTVKAENAIFYINSFKTRCGRDCNCIIRKTTDGVPGHFSFEVKCFM
ncbi:hypothetical protein CARUB_v10007081mg [Capsella rubella]|uniref:Uncharacterized protein n=1 Tax=Capsella rubella TaxID=81985 RepID=R0FA25_9BRAS|nr:hypothetical protein CARUB_v10007081mg [Capsella rubella]